MTLEYSAYQKAIFNNIENGEGNLVVNALAGSGKTFVILESLQFINPRLSTLLVAFNSEIAKVLRKRAPEHVHAFTSHAIGLKQIGKVYSGVQVDNDKVPNFIGKLFKKQKELNVLIPSLIQTVSLAKACLVWSAEAIDELIEEYDIDLDEELLSREEFINHVLFTLNWCKKNTNIVDYDDMIWFPNVLDIPMVKYDHIYVDEGQDLNYCQRELILKLIKPKSRCFVLGDSFQCVDKNTLLETKHGPITVDEIQIGTEILSYLNGQNKFCKILNKQKSNWNDGIEIVTKSGKTLLMSPNHKIYATIPKIGLDKYIVYLMYREDLGFRVGKTNKTLAKTNPYGARAGHEKADKLWIIKILNSNEEAIFEEECISLKFGIPTAVFEAEARDLNQDRVNKIFAIFGQNGFKLLKDYNFSFDHPHWHCKSFSNADNIGRQVIQVKAHTKKYGSLATVEWKNEEICKIFDNANLKYYNSIKKNGDFKNWRWRYSSTNYHKMIEVVTNLSNASGFDIHEKMSNLNNIKGDEYNKLSLMPASQLYVGSKILVKKDDKFEPDEILEIKEKSGEFYDLYLENSGNFYGNEILSHNSLYGFRGADPNSISKFQQALNAKPLPLNISYRCSLEVIKEAKKLVPVIEPSPNAIPGSVSWIEQEEVLETAQPGCFILSRTNAPLIRLALNFLKRGIPANILGRNLANGLLFLLKKSRAKKIDTFLTYLNKWEKEESERVINKGRQPTVIHDKAECMRTLSEDCATVDELKAKIRKLFEDPISKTIMLGTTHAAKGLEADDVYICRSTFSTKSQEEKNILYVAITRSKDRLFYFNYEPSLLSDATQDISESDTLSNSD
jgi:hypothetical protein